jgi:predicted amidohydrolase YtcJ
MPVSEWLREGALLGSRSDYRVGPCDAIRCVSGIVKRQTGVGVLGSEHTIDRVTAVGLYTTGAVRLLGERDERGTLEPGKLADFAPITPTLSRASSTSWLSSSRC